MFSVSWLLSFLLSVVSLLLHTHTWMSVPHCTACNVLCKSIQRTKEKENERPYMTRLNFQPSTSFTQSHTVKIFFSSHNMTNLQWHFPSFIIISLFSIPIQHTHSLSLEAETTRRTWFQNTFLPSSAVAIFRSTSSSTFLVLGPVVPGVVRPQVSFAAETVGKDPDCNDASCLGVWDGLLADCPHYDKIAMYSGSAGCASSQDDTPGVFAEP